LSKANDLEGQQDMGGKHGGQAGMPKPEDRSGTQQGIVKDEKGQDASKKAIKISGLKSRNTSLGRPSTHS
jgi:hypothetical protein